MIHLTEPQIWFVLGSCGILTHLIVKYDSLRKDAKVANSNLSVGKYISTDWPGIILAILPVIVWMFTFGEAAKFYPALTDSVRCSFFGVGILGSWVVQLLTSKAKKNIRTIVDQKTDIADNKTSEE